MARTLLLVGIGVAGGAYTAGYVLGSQWLWTPGIAILALLWLFGYWRGWDWIASLGLVGYAGVAVAGLSLGLGAGWMLLGLVATLCAWDLQRFVLCLDGVARVEAGQALERQHLQRLLIVAGLGLFLATVALTVEIRLSFLLALLLGTLAVLGLSRAVSFLRREGD